MAKQTINNGDSGAMIRNGLNNMFGELYSGFPAAATFNTAIPFTARQVMPRQQVVGALTFTKNIAGAILGAAVDVELVADGANVPDFSAFKEWGGSAGYLNTTGMVNLCRFEFTGLDYIVSVNQLVSPVAAPRLSSVAATVGANTVTMNYDRALNSGSTPPASAFAITNTGGTQTVSSVSVTGSTVVLATSRTVVSGDVIAVSYTPPTANGVLSSTGEFAGGVSAYSVTVSNPSAPANTAAPSLSTTTPAVGVAVTVTNGTWTNSPTGYTYQWYWADTGAAISGATTNSYTPVSGDTGHTLKCTVTAANASGSASANSNTSAAVGTAVNYLRYTSKNGAMVETVNGGGYNYGIASGAVNFGSGYGTGTAALKMAAATATASIQTTNGWNNGTTDGFFFGLITSAGAPAGYSSFKYAFWLSTNGGNTKYSYWGPSGDMGQGEIQMTMAQNDLLRIRKASGNLYFEVSKDNGATWTIGKTITGITSEDLYPAGLVCAPSLIIQPTYTGLT